MKKQRDLRLLRKDFSGQRAKYLHEFASAVSESDMENIEEFRETLKFAFEMGIERIKFADAMSVSEATVSRWVNERVTPHLIVRKAVPEYMAKVALQHAEELEKKYKK